MHRLRHFVPSANYLFCFEAAARRGSFTAAAEELNVSQPAVSKTIRLLEEATGLQLFRRGRGGLELTPEGQRLYTEVQGSFDHLHMVISSLQRKGSGDTVRVSFSSSFVQSWLLARLGDFRTRHPHVALRIEESSRDDQDLAAEDIDLSARLGDGKWHDTQAWKFFDEEVIPVCSPAYLARHAPITQPADFLGHALLDFEERHRTRLGWHEWLERHGVNAARLRFDFIFTDALGSLRAATLGQGVALGWRHLVQEHLESGELVPAWNQPFRSGHAIHLIMPAQRRPKPDAVLFRDWLLEQAAQDRAAGRA